MTFAARVASDAALTVGLGRMRLKPARAALLEEELEPDDDEETLDPAGEPDVLVSDDSESD